MRILLVEITTCQASIGKPGKVCDLAMGTLLQMAKASHAPVTNF